MCKRRVDLGFVIEVSSSVGRRNIRNIRLFVRDMIRRFVISYRQTRIGIIIYSSRARRILSFNQRLKPRHIQRLLLRIRYRGGRRYTGRALLHARRYLFPGNAKCGRKRVLIVLTSGVSRDRVSQPARSLAGIGVEIFVVVSSGRAVRQMRTIITTRQHLYVSFYNNLVRITDRLRNKICVTPRGMNERNVYT